MLTDDALKAITDATAAASPGPWDIADFVDIDGHVGIATDWEFVIGARSWVPALLETVRELKRQLIVAQATLPTLLTEIDVGLWLRLSPRKVVRMARKGQLPHRILPCGDLVFDKQELRLWLEQCEHHAGASAAAVSRHGP